jgi:glycosyltransferase involved in cell wall biosynthesis
VKVLLLSRYDRLGASSRVRFLQYLPLLQKCGIEVTTQSLLPDVYLRRLYRGQKDWRLAISGFAARIRALRRYRDYQLLWIEKEMFPWFPFWVESYWLDGPAVLLDYDDAIFHNYDLSKRWGVRALLGSKIDLLMSRAGAVGAGSQYLAKRAKDAGATVVEMLPTAVDLDLYKPKHRPTGSSGCAIGWIGTPRTAAYLQYIAPSLAEVVRACGSKLLLVGAGQVSLPGLKVEVREWDENTEQNEIASFDIGIMPVPDAPWERGKCGYKLIQYMACGLPVVASPVGANNDIVEHGKNGFLAVNAEEWVHYLTLLAKDPDLRYRLGLNGRRKVEREYSVGVVAPKLMSLMMRTAKH